MPVYCSLARVYKSFCILYFCPMLENHLKEALYGFCQVFINDRIVRIHSQIKEIQQALGSETKSSAGDKHETGRAMLQLEREKVGRQLAEAEKIKQVLAQVHIGSNSDTIGLGSLTRTTKGNYFLAISAGEYKDKDQSVYCISINTPIGRLLLGKSARDSFVFNGEEIVVLEIG